MEIFNAKLQVKELDAQGRFVGLASVYNNVDLGGDVVMPGAFSRTLKARGNEVPILYQHNMREPIGLGTLTDTASGLQIEGKLVLTVARAKEAFDLMRERILKGLSIGYDVVRDEIRSGARHLKELKLYEVSLVTLPMNELATISVVKSREDLEPQIRQFQQLLAAARKAWQ
jgi:HK97 family phage prohead protease